MSIISVIVILAIIGFLAWLVDTYIPMSDPIRKVIRALVAIMICLWLLKALGIWNGGLSLAP